MTKTFTGEVKTIHLSRCDCCGALVKHVEKVITLRGNRDNPTEYANACPECNGLDSFTDVESIVASTAKRLSVSTEIEVEWFLRKQKLSLADARYIIEQAKAETTIIA